MTFQKHFLGASIFVNVALVMGSMAFAVRQFYGWVILSWFGIGIIVKTNEIVEDWGK